MEGYQDWGIGARVLRRRRVPLNRRRSGAPVLPTPWERDRPAQVDAADSGILFVVLFWYALAASVELWWLDTPARSVTTPAQFLVAGGRITGMIAGFVLLIQVLLMSRVGWLERGMGPHAVAVWHRELGSLLGFLVLLHVVLIVTGYAGEAKATVGATVVSLLTMTKDIVTATIATGILFAIGLMAIRAVRRILPYEIWYYLHASGYLVLLLAYGHEFADGQELEGRGFGHWYWIGLYLFVVACVVWGRVVVPVRLNRRHRLRVIQVAQESPDMISIYIGGERLDEMRAHAGQYFRWRFLAPGCWWQAHPFSLSAAPNGNWLRLTVKVVGDHTADLARLRPGVRVFAEGPSGVFTAQRRRRRRALLVAGGSGIAPIRALLEELPPGAVVLYRARDEDELAFHDELDWLARENGAKVWYVLGGRDDPGPRRLFTAQGIRELVPDVRRRDVYLCGPTGLVSMAVKLLRQVGVPEWQLHLDPFEF